MPSSRGRSAATERAIGRARGDLWWEGNSLNACAFALYSAGRLAEVLERSREAARVFGRAGDRWEAHSPAAFTGKCLQRAGDLAGALEEAKRLYRSGLELGDTAAPAIVLAIWARASGSRVPESAVARELERPLELVTGAFLFEADGPRLLGENRFAEAAAVTRRAVRVGRCCPNWLPHALREAAWFSVPRRAGGGAFGDEDERLARYIAALAGAALEMAEGFAERERAEADIRGLSAAALGAQEDERWRLALALHDGAGRALTALDVKLDRVARGTRDAEIRAELERASAITAALFEDLRRLSHDLRPAALDSLGLGVALGDLAAGVATPSLKIEVAVEPQPFPALTPEVALAGFRIAQAALANVVCHARARRARISLGARAGEVSIEVEDDGLGFDPAALRPGEGIGLIGVRERAGWLGGQLEIEAASGHGSRIRAVLPPGGKKA